MKVYLDNNSTTKPHPQVLKIMNQVADQQYANPSSTHCMGQVSKAQLEHARQTVALNLNVPTCTICFTSGSTESNNMVIRSKGTGGLVLISAIEHPSVTTPAKTLARKWEEIPVDKNGQITPDLLSKALYHNQNVQLICIMLANNEVGTIMDIRGLVAVARARAPRAHFHCDATQYAGRWYLNVSSLGVDSLCMSAHKFHGPRGIGVLYCRSPLKSCSFGGGQEHGTRPGTENLPAIVGLATALEINVGNKNKNEQEWKRQTALRNTLRAAIIHYFPRAQINGENASALLPNTLSVSIPGLDSRRLLNSVLCPKGIIVNAGAACSQGKRSRVLEAMGVSSYHENGTFRFAISAYTTTAEIKYTIAILEGMARQQQRQ